MLAANTLLWESPDIYRCVAKRNTRVVFIILLPAPLLSDSTGFCMHSCWSFEVFLREAVIQGEFGLLPTGAILCFSITLVLSQQLRTL